MNEETIQTLNKIMPVVARVHGEHHPELHQVLELYNEVKTAPSAELFKKLRNVTGNYAVQEDAARPTPRRISCWRHWTRRSHAEYEASKTRATG